MNPPKTKDPKTVVVVGACGFIGSVTVATLVARGHTVVAMDDQMRNFRNLAFPGFSIFPYGKLKKVDAQAALFEFLQSLARINDGKIDAMLWLGGESATDLADFADILERDEADLYSGPNIFQPIVFANIAHNLGVPRFIWASSAAVYGNEGDRTVFRDVPEKPISPYGWSKLMLDNNLLASPPAPMAVGLRFFNVYGPNEYHKVDSMSASFLSALAVRSHRHEQFEYIDYGEVRRDFVSVLDCADIMAHLVECELIKQAMTVDIGPGNPVALDDVVELVGQHFDRRDLLRTADMKDLEPEGYQVFTIADPGDVQRKTGYSDQYRDTKTWMADYLTKYLPKGGPIRYFSPAAVR